MSTTNRRSPFALGELVWRRMLTALVVGFAFTGRVGISADAKRTPILRFSHNHGFYNEPLEVSMSVQNADARIFYTTNGMAPSVESATLYERPVAIATTSILRAASFENGLRTSPIKTQTYLYARDVLKQTGAGFPRTWGVNKGKPVPADYEMDPKIVNHPDYRGVLERALQSIPRSRLSWSQTIFLASTAFICTRRKPARTGNSPRPPN